MKIKTFRNYNYYTYCTDNVMKDNVSMTANTSCFW